ncbi:MAG: 16S rRNA (cytosine(967)-C(5))-methyltransferase RsmB [Clostridia bacterium]|nr:16S rRNA (cytosine(967)-C(5))-methyltransferase RsmB [Clostridia bacterium]
MADARKVAIKALSAVVTDSGFSNLVIDKYINEASLSSLDASFASALFYGTLERLKTVDYIIEKASGRKISKIDKECINVLRTAVYSIYYMDKVHDGAAVNEAVKLVKKTKKSFLSGFVNAVLRKISRERDSFLPSENDLEIYYSCDQSIVDSFVNDYGFSTAKEILENSLKNSETTLRINSLRIKDDEFLAKLDIQGLEYEYLGKNKVKLKKSGDIENNPLYKDGLFHVQSVVSSLCAEAVGAKKGDTVLDTCAAPGGKSFTMAELMQNEGTLISCDIHPHRVELIKKGTERLGITNIIPTLSDATNPTLDVKEFDEILCDVPCSGLGMLCEKPDIKYKKISNFEELPSLQYEILETSAKMLKSGGRLVYSTCTLRKVENECVTEKFINNNKEFEITSQKTYFPNEYGSGFFVSVIERR